MLNRLRKFVSDWFTRVESDLERPTALAHTTRKQRNRRRARTVAPSERFVWAMSLLIIALVGVIILEGVTIVVTGQVNAELLSVISGLVGSLVTAFLMGKR